MARTLQDLTVDHLGATATEQDLTDFKAAVERVLPAFRGNEARAINYIWNDGDCYRRMLDAGQTPNDGSLLGEVLAELRTGEYVIDDGATDWDPDTLFDELAIDDLLTEVYCEINTDADDTGRVGYIARFDDAGYIQGSPPMYRIYLASKR